MEIKNGVDIPKNRSTCIAPRIQILRGKQPKLFENEIDSHGITQFLESGLQDDWFEGWRLIIERINAILPDCVEIIAQWRKQNRLPLSKSPLFISICVAVISLLGIAWLAP